MVASHTWYAKGSQRDNDVEEAQFGIRGAISLGPLALLLVDFLLKVWVSIVPPHNCSSILHLLSNMSGVRK